LRYGIGGGESLRPAYALDEIKAKVSAGDYYPTGAVRRVLAKHDWDESDVEACVAGLSPSDFDKSQPHKTRRGVRLDIYKPIYEDIGLYVKFVIDEDGKTIVVLDFCEDGEFH